MSEPKIKVLYIDDELHNLNAFKAAFRREYDILLAESAEEGRAVLQQQESEIPVIISDQRMPGETGIEFFESIKDIYPYSLRILLTGYTDIQAVISAVNIGNIFRYLQKPWNEEEIHQTILAAFEIYHSRVQLIEKNKELEKAYNELDKFVYSASHDMRAPLMSILGITRLARLEKDQEPEPYFVMIEQSVLKLDDFIKNIIDYYKNNRFDQEIKSIDLKTLIENCIESNRYQTGSKEIDFRLKVDQQAEFKSDELKLSIILNNLISNAIKYRNESANPPFVDVSAQCDENQAVIRVADNGVGIPESEIENIFKMFYRAANNNSGSGIGLYIVKDAITRLEGTISLQSALDQGTTFQLEIPNKL